MTNDAITDLDALSLSHAIHARRVSCVEVMRAYLARIHRLNPRFTAIVNLAADDLLLAQAAERDAELVRGASRGAGCMACLRRSRMPARPSASPPPSAVR